MPGSDSAVDDLAELLRERSTEGAAERAGPFMVGVGGPVAAGKSTFSAQLSTAIDECSDGTSVQVMSTDSFLRSNAELERLGLTMSKGAPATYDHDAMRGALARLRNGEVDVDVPQYSHRTYDLISGGSDPYGAAEVLIVEGLHVAAVSELLDVVIYLDAGADDLQRWFVDRFERLRLESTDDPGSFFHQFADLDADTADVVARWTWTEINLVNIVEHIKPTRAGADVVVSLDSSHGIARIDVR